MQIFKPTLKNHFSIFNALLLRDLKRIKAEFTGNLIDALFLTAAQLLIMGKLFPLLGMPIKMVGPIYFSQVTFQAFFFGYGLGLQVLFDLQGNRFLDYELTLPVPKKWVFAKYIASFLIKTSLVLIPLFFSGTILLGDALIGFSPRWPLFFLSYFLSIIFIGVLFLTLAMYYDFHWYMNNLWARRLNLFMFFAPNFFIWITTYRFSKFFGNLMLLNPITYCIEALRDAMFTSYEFIPAYICIPLIICSVILTGLALSFGIKKRLNPV